MWFVILPRWKECKLSERCFDFNMLGDKVAWDVHVAWERLPAEEFRGRRELEATTLSIVLQRLGCANRWTISNVLLVENGPTTQNGCLRGMLISVHVKGQFVP